MCSKRETIHNSEQQFINPCISTVFIGPRCPWGPIYGSGFLKLSEPPFADLTDVTLADEDTNSILMLIMPIGQSKAMQMTKPGEKICN